MKKITPKSSSKFFSAYYFFNLLLISSYPILRASGNQLILNTKDILGYKKEDSVLTILSLILLLRFLRHFTNWEKFICDIFFYTKCAISCLLILISIKLAIWFLFAWFAIFLLVKYPRYSGPSNIAYISDEQNLVRFAKVPFKTEKYVKCEDVYLLMVFYSEYSFDCIYTEELFAKISLKYISPCLKYGKMDVDLNDLFAERLGINLKGLDISLPVLVMFKNGEEIMRMPSVDNRGVRQKIKFFREKDIVETFKLKEILDNTSNY